MTNTPRIHFIGIGGIGMSALARWFKAQGWAVSGSDAVRSDITAALRKEGMHIAIGHKKSNVGQNTAIVIYNRAIPKGNQELVAVRKWKIPVIPYATILGDITKKYKTIAITGSHGKSTTTALAGLSLIKGGLDPTILIGTNLKELHNKNIRMGRSQYLVLEADDFGGAFWHYSPTFAIVTNIDREHLDFYNNFDGVKRGFLKFISRIKPGGTLIVNQDDLGISKIKNQISKIAGNNNIRVIWYSTKCLTAKKIKKVIGIPGVHNVSNAMAVYALGKTLLIPDKKILATIHNYHGSWRRMEYKGELRIKNHESSIRNKKNGIIHNSKFLIPIYDDYAHHPTEIKATLQAFKEKYPQSPLICVFQPHQAARLKALFGEFQTAFTDADITLIMPAYNPTGRDIIDPKHDSAALVKAIQFRRAKAVGAPTRASEQKSKNMVFYLADPKNLINALQVLIPTLNPKPYSLNPVLIMMGAGSIAEETKKLLGT